MNYISEARNISDSPEVRSVNAPPHTLSELLARGEWAALAARLGFSTEYRAPIPAEAFAAWGIDGADAGVFDQVEVLAATPDYRVLHVDDRSESGDYLALRRLIFKLRRLNPETLIIWWWTRADRLTVATYDEHPDGRRFVRRVDIERDDPDALSLEQLKALDISAVAGDDLADRAGALRRHIKEVLGQQRLTREFFAGFTRALGLLCAEMQDGPTDARERHDVALATLLRLVFLYFLQARGALDGDRRFVLRWLRQARAAQQNFYRGVLRPLFFGALNQPKESRDAAVGKLGELPFLNGGLFEPLPVENLHEQLSWPDAVFAEVIENLLERYQFAVEEMQGADEQRAVDPEMLGRVFEGLMYGKSRQKSGSFYTPRDVVRKLVDESMAGYLEDKTELGAAQIQALLAGDAVDFDAPTRDTLRRALDAVRILDPAVGTGAFLLEALQVLRRCRRAVDGEGGASHQDPLADYREVRNLIHAHLFGVDIQHTAVRLCELRLWLALLTTLPAMAIDEMPPLPNLSHKVCVGNSLLSPTDLLNLRSGRSTFAADGEPGRDLVAQLEQAQCEYLTTHGAPKLKIRARIKGLETQLQCALLDARRSRLKARLNPLKSLGESHDLFGDKVRLNQPQRVEASKIDAELSAIEAAVAALKAGRESPLAFSYATRFGQLLARGGFDIVITNPPWVRAQHIDAAHGAVLRSRYSCQHRKLWPGAKDAGISTPYGPQVDLAALFIERSLELLRPGGRLCGLVPAKLFSSLHGAALREQLAAHDLVALEDYSDGTRRIFDATVYPAMLHVRKSAQGVDATAPPKRPAAPMRLTVWRGDKAQSWRAKPRELFATADQPGAPWMLAEPRVLGILERMRASSVTLGEVPALQPTRGLFTGCNDVFIGADTEICALLGKGADTFSRPVLSGRDVRPWSVRPKRRILWPYDANLELRDDLPEALRAHFLAHEKRLKGRSDFRPDKAPWQIFRVTPGLLKPKVVWRDLSPKLEAALAPADVVPLNTVYFIAMADERRARLFAALLNSAPMRAAAYTLAERARGGWRRHFAWVMRLLPVPQRFVDFIEGKDDPKLLEFEAGFCRRGAGEPGAECREALDRFSGELFGLSADEVAYLRAWRLGEEAA